MSTVCPVARGWHGFRSGRRFRAARLPISRRTSLRGARSWIAVRIGAVCLAASEEAYASVWESYRSAGLATVLDVLAAQRDLARARTTEIQSRADLLSASAALALAAED